MNSSILSSPRVALVERNAGVAPVPARGIRDLLRDTALLVSSFANGGQPENFESLRKHCRELIDQFASALDRRGFGADVRRDALIAQCALLDETALHRLPDNDRWKWTAQPLQVEVFKEHDAGETVFRRLEERMRESSPDVELLECYAALLGLGFRGRYALDGEDKRQALMASLGALIQRLRPDVPRSFLIEETGAQFGNWFRRASPWTIAGIAFVIALGVWFAWHVALDAQLAALLSKPGKP